MLIPGELKPYNLHGSMPELTFTVMLLKKSLLKREGIHKSLGLKEQLSRARFIGRDLHAFKFTTQPTCVLHGRDGGSEGLENLSALCCTGLSSV